MKGDTTDLVELAERLETLTDELEAGIGPLAAELTRIHRSRLWRIGSVYWAFRRSIHRRWRDWTHRGEPTGPPDPEAARVAVPPDIVCLPADDRARPGRLDPLLGRLSARGHRVFRLTRCTRGEGRPPTVRPLEANLYEVAVGGGAADVLAGRPAPEAEQELFACLDTLRREQGLGGTLTLVENSNLRAVAERAWREWSWPMACDCGGNADSPFAIPLELMEREERIERLRLMMREAFPPASIVIATRNHLEACRRCLESVFRATAWPNFEVIAVDDASTDGTPAYLGEAQCELQTLHVVLNDRAEGHPAAFNAGLGRAHGDVLVLLSDDAVVTHGWLSALVRHLRRDPHLGAIGPASNTMKGAARARYDGIAGLAPWAARFVREHDGESSDDPTAAMVCLAMRRDVFEQVGPLETESELAIIGEYGHRVRRRGRSIRRAYDSFVHQEQARPSGAARPRRLTSPARGRLRPLLEAADRSRGAIVFPPTVGWSLPLFQRPHHLARAFAAAGYTVVFDCSNSRDDVERLREIEPRLFLFRGRFDELHGLQGAIVWTFPYNVRAGLEFPGGARTVYDWIDDLSVFTDWDAGFIRSSHEQALARATVVTAVARPLHVEALKARPDALYLPNAVDYRHFAGAREPAEDPKLAAARAEGRPVAGYYGALARWLDHELLEGTARLRPDWIFVLVGPNHEGGLSGAHVLRCPNVIWTGARDYGVLPEYAALFDVAMIPFRINPITRATSPLKLYEYFAAGRPVVATPLPECESFPEVRIVRGAADLAEALEAARVDAADPAFVARLRDLGRMNSWDARVSDVLTHLERLEASRPFRS